LPVARNQVFDRNNAGEHAVALARRQHCFTEFAYKVDDALRGRGAWAFFELATLR
jgi:hypothetical protein